MFIAQKTENIFTIKGYKKEKCRWGETTLNDYKKIEWYNNFIFCFICRGNVWTL